MCVGCGACVPACAEGRVRLVDVVDDGLRPLVDHPESCGSCRDCLRVCPGWEIDHRALRRAPGAERSLLRTCGPVLEVWEGYASDPDIRRQGSSGGMITALALHAVERGGMHGTLHIGADERRPLASRAHLSRTRGELLARAGSRYAPAAPCVGLTLIAEAPAPCVFAGKPCDVTGLARSIALRPGLGRKVGLTLSFFCAGTPATQGTLDLLARRGVNPESVGALRYRGDGWPGMFRADAAGDGAPLARLSYAESWGFLQAYRPYRCYLCPDGTGEDADIACGDPWYRAPREGEAGASLVLVRTERGRRALAAAREAGYVRAERAAPSLVTAAQRRLLEKRRALWGRLLTMRALGVPAPRLRGFSLFANWLGLPAREKLRSTAGAARRILSRGYRAAGQSHIPAPTRAGAGRSAAGGGGRLTAGSLPGA